MARRPLMQLKTLVLAAAAVFAMYHYPQQTKDFITRIPQLNKEQLELGARGFPFGFLPLLSPIGLYKSIFIENTSQTPQARKAFNNGMIAGFASLCLLGLYKPHIALGINIAALAGLIIYPKLRNSQHYPQQVNTAQITPDQPIHNTIHTDA